MMPASYRTQGFDAEIEERVTYSTTWRTTLSWPWYNLHSDISKKCLALWPRIDFDILGVKIRVLEFHKTTFFLHIICSTLAFFLPWSQLTCLAACTTLQGRHLADTILGAFAA